MCYIFMRFFLGGARTMILLQHCWGQSLINNRTELTRHSGSNILRLLISVHVLCIYSSHTMVQWPCLLTCKKIRCHNGRCYFEVNFFTWNKTLCLDELLSCLKMGEMWQQGFSTYSAIQNDVTPLPYPPLKPMTSPWHKASKAMLCGRTRSH